MSGTFVPIPSSSRVSTQSSVPHIGKGLPGQLWLNLPLTRHSLQFPLWLPFLCPAGSSGPWGHPAACAGPAGWKLHFCTKDALHGLGLGTGPQNKTVHKGVRQA